MTPEAMTRLRAVSAETPLTLGDVRRLLSRYLPMERYLQVMDYIDTLRAQEDTHAR